MRLTFRLSEAADPDLITEMEKIPKRDRSRTVREALRAYFFKSNSNTPEKDIRAPEMKLELSGDETKEEAQDPDDKLDDLLSSF